MLWDWHTVLLLRRNKDFTGWEASTLVLVLFAGFMAYSFGDIPQEYSWNNLETTLSFGSFLFGRICRDLFFFSNKDSERLSVNKPTSHWVFTRTVIPLLCCVTKQRRPVYLHVNFRWIYLLHLSLPCFDKIQQKRVRKLIIPTLQCRHQVVLIEGFRLSAGHNFMLRQMRKYCWFYGREGIRVGDTHK